MIWTTGQSKAYICVAVETQMEQTKEVKVPSVMVHVQAGNTAGIQCVTVTVQQQWAEGGGNSEVTVHVQQGQNTPRVTVEVQKEWNKAEELLCTFIKVQQQTSEKEIPGPCVTAEVQPKSQGNVSHKNVHCQASDMYEDNLHRNQDPSQSQRKEGVIGAEVEQQQQDCGETNMIESKLLQEDANDSVVKESLLQQDSWNSRIGLLEVPEFRETDERENTSEGMAFENKLHNSQDAEPTKMVHMCLLSSTEEDFKETVNNLQQERGSTDGHATGQQQLSSDTGVPVVIAEEKAHEEPTGSKKYRKDLPNYFVAIPITSEQILDTIEDVQELIFTKEPNLLRALVPVQTMHLTIIVAHLRTDDDVKRAVSALEHSKAKVQTLLQGKLFSMTFHGIGQFNNQVVYVKMSEDEQQMLSKIAEAVESSFMEMNVEITASKDFRPHLTFLKLSKAPALRRKGFRKIREDLYTEYEDSPFGTEILNRIDLCAMHKKKQDSGYYHCESSINVGPTCSEDNDDIEEPVNDPKEEVHGVALSNNDTSDHARAEHGGKDPAGQSHYEIDENIEEAASSIRVKGRNGMSMTDTKTRANDETFTRWKVSQIST